jgi:hypothetical protein
MTYTDPQQPTWPPQQPNYQQWEPQGGYQRQQWQPPAGFSQPPGHRARPPRKSRAPKIILWSIAGAIVFCVLIAIIGSATAGKSTATGDKKPAAPAASAPTPALSPSPAPAPAPPKVLLTMSGSGIQNSAPFTVGGQVTATYTFNCSSFGSSGNFEADLLYGNQASLNSDDQNIANALAMSGGSTTTVYPADPGRRYYLSVNSECNWTVKLVSP